MNLKDFKKLYPYLNNQMKLLILGIITTIVCSFITVPVPYFIGYIVDEILLKSKNLKALNLLILLIITIYVLEYFISIFNKYIFAKIRIFMINKLKSDLLNKVMKLPMDYITCYDKGYLASRITECNRVGDLLNNTLITSFIRIIETIGIFIIMVIINYKLSLLVIIAFPIYFKITKLSADALSKSTKKLLEETSILNGELYENIEGIEEIKILNVYDKQLRKFNIKLNIMASKNIEQSKSVAFYIQNMILSNNLISTIILYVSALMIFNDTLTLGTYTAFSVYAMKILANTQAIANIGVILTPIKVSMDRVFEILSLDNSENQKKELLKESITNISIKNLYFKYKNKDRYAIENLSFNMEKGDKILLKGTNGSGKSTFIKILLGLYSLTEGEILINDINYEELDKKSILEKIGVVSQNIFLFKGTVLENILYNSFSKTKQDVLELIENYNMKDIFDSFANGLDTLVVNNGENLSGGQRQIIALLRAIITKKNILIMDEATTNIDEKTHKIIEDIISFKNISNILIIVSHKNEGISFINKTVNFSGNDNVDYVQNT